MMRIFFWNCLLVLIAGIFGWSCNNKDNGSKDQYNKGTIYISCDESFKPVIDAQIQVYLADKPEAKIIVQYKPGAECLKDLFNDTIRMVIATRGYSTAEQNKMLDSIKIGGEKLTVARDAIAVIVHPSNPESDFTIPEIRKMIQGKHKKNLIPVFDGLRATSTVRFMIDSVLHGESFGPNVVAAQNSLGVIDYVSKTPNAIGFIGVSWVGSQVDTAGQTVGKVKIARLLSTDSANAYVLPVQYLIYTKTYPMIRDLVYVLKEQHYGLGKGFANFLKSERGQLVFRRAFLQPAIRPFYIRNAELEE